MRNALLATTLSLTVLTAPVWAEDVTPSAAGTSPETLVQSIPGEPAPIAQIVNHWIVDLGGEPSAMVSAAVTRFPEHAVLITRTAVNAAPDQIDAIIAAAVAAAPDQAELIVAALTEELPTAAGLEASPFSGGEISNLSALPSGGSGGGSGGAPTASSS